MAFALLSRSGNKPQGSVKPVPKQKSAGVLRPAESRFGFLKPVVQTPIAAQPTVSLIQTKLKIGEPNDKFEQEADRVADEVMKIPEALPPGTAISTSASLYPSSAIQPHRIECVHSGDLFSQCLDKEKIESNTLTETTAHVQREPGEGNKPDRQVSPKNEYNKAELEFHSALHFNRTFSGFNPTGEPKEGEYPIIWWRVWNTGWKTAPEHYNRLTIYKADLCSGCRNEKDEIFRLEMLEPSIVSITQQGKSDYESAYLIGMTLHAGHYDAYVELDVHNDVEEINEDNNTAFMTFDVKPASESESAIEGEEESIRPKKDAGPAPDVGPDVESQISALRGRGQPLPQSLRAFFEPRFGCDFRHVRVHTDENAETSARAINAHAYTVGNDIVFGTGRFDSNTKEGRRLLAHELAHVVQQSAGHAPRVIARQPAKVPPKAPSYRDCTEATTLSGNSNQELETARVFAHNLVDAAIGALAKNDGSETYRIALARHFIAPTFEDRKEIIRAYRFIDGYLKPEKFRCASSKEDIAECKKNPEAGIVPAFTNVEALKLPDTVICASFWNFKLPCRAITLIHEAAHGVGIGNDAAHPPYRGSPNYPELAAAPKAGVTTAARKNNPDAYAHFAAHIGRETDTQCFGIFASEPETIEVHDTPPKSGKK